MLRILVSLLILGTLCSTVFSQRGTTTLISVSTAGVQGNTDSSFPAISANGRYVAFPSYASNLVPGDTNEHWDVFLRDTQTNQTSRVSVSSSGGQGNTWSDFPCISGNGRYVAYYSAANNLVVSDTNGSHDVFVHDIQTGLTSRVSVSSSNVQANDDSGPPSICSDGRYVAFPSLADNLVPGDTNAVYDVFVRDRQTGETSRVSVPSPGEEGNSDSFNPVISLNGRYVVFRSRATNLVANDTNGTDDLFVHDRETDQTIRVSISSSGEQGDDVSGDFLGASISDDGRYVAFQSLATNLVPGDTNGTDDVFVRDIMTSETTRISVSSSGTQGNGSGIEPAISADGRLVVFNSSATNMVSGDTNARDDVFVHDRQTGQTSRVSTSSSGQQGNNDSKFGNDISADGRFVAFASYASNLVQGDTSGLEVFVHQYGPSELQPNAFVVTAGFRFSGDLTSLFLSDDTVLGIFPDEATLVAQVEVNATSPSSNPTSIIFTYEGSAGRLGLSQTVRLRNYALGTYTLVDSRMAPVIDTTIQVILTTAVEHVGPNRVMAAEVTWQPINDEDPSQDGWLHSIDLVHWTIE